MRLVIACFAMIAFHSIACGAAIGEDPTGNLTIVLDFDGPRSDASITEMKRELESIMQDSGLRVSWRLRDEVAGESFPDLVLVRFKGKCRMEPTPLLYDERGPLAFTYTSGNVILPFSEVECDKVRVSIRSAMQERDFVRGDLLLGRALGRVLAHELYHIMGKTAGHGSDGVAGRALSGAQLIANELRLQPADAAVVKASIAGQPATGAH
jgi:hypothetical protein